VKRRFAVLPAIVMRKAKRFHHKATKITLQSKQYLVRLAPGSSNFAIFVALRCKYPTHTPPIIARMPP
jgi:hypothetical protein